MRKYLIFIAVGLFVSASVFAQTNAQGGTHNGESGTPTKAKKAHHAKHKQYTKKVHHKKYVQHVQSYSVPSEKATDVKKEGIGSVSNVPSQAEIAAAKPFCNEECARRAYIDRLNLPQSTKNLLYAYSTTKEGQQVLDRVMHPSLLGPTSSSFFAPIAFSDDWRSVSAGVGYVNHWPDGGGSDGFAGVTVGFGDAEKYVGLAVTALIDSINPFDGGFAENGTIAAQLFHVFPHDFALAIGAGNILPWGALKDDATSYYAVATKIFDTSINKYSMPLTVSLGAGTGGFYSIGDAQDKRDGSIKPFGSIGWRVLPRLSVIGEWITKETNVGISVVPIAKLPVVFNIADCNIAHSEGRSSYILVSLAVGYRF